MEFGKGDVMKFRSNNATLPFGCQHAVSWSAKRGTPDGDVSTKRSTLFSRSGLAQFGGVDEASLWFIGMHGPEQLTKSANLGRLSVTYCGVAQSILGPGVNRETEFYCLR